VVLSNGKSDIHGVTAAIEEILFPAAQLRLAIDVSPYKLSRWNAAEFPDTARWRFERSGAGVTATLADRKSKHVIATADLPTGVAEKLATDMAAMLAGGRKLAAGGMSAGAYLGPYTLKEGRLNIEDGVEVMLMPRYRGQGENGPVVDERITFVLVDRNSRQWPVMSKLDRETAEAFVAGVRAALGR
jgi:hypothetical protein